jgi:hypothetical protein
LRGLRRFGAAAALSLPASALAEDAFAAAGFRVARGLAGVAGVAGSTPESAAMTGSAATADTDDAFRLERGLAGEVAAAVVAEAGLRAARGLAAALAGAPSAASVATDRSVGSAVGAVGVDAPRLGAGFCATCARSNASSSGGTSLHGSFELRGTGAGPGRSPPRA